VWDSAAFSSIFLASSFSCSQALSTPAHTQVTQAITKQTDGYRLNAIVNKAEKISIITLPRVYDTVERALEAGAILTIADHKHKAQAHTERTIKNGRIHR
jgi:predicted methyltransferase